MANKDSKSKCPLPFPWLWVFVLVAGAAAGIVAWRRSQPIEDPWAEESWEDIDEDMVIVSPEGE